MTKWQVHGKKYTKHWPSWSRQNNLKNLSVGHHTTKKKHLKKRTHTMSLKHLMTIYFLICITSLLTLSFSHLLQVYTKMCVCVRERNSHVRAHTDKMQMSEWNCADKVKLMFKNELGSWNMLDIFFLTVQHSFKNVMKSSMNIRF